MLLKWFKDRLEHCCDSVMKHLNHVQILYNPCTFPAGFYTFIFLKQLLWKSIICQFLINSQDHDTSHISGKLYQQIHIQVNLLQNQVCECMCVHTHYCIWKREWKRARKFVFNPVNLHSLMIYKLPWNDITHMQIGAWCNLATWLQLLYY